MHLQNLVMQLRKVSFIYVSHGTRADAWQISSHPFLFDWPSNDQGELVVDEDLVNASGKMLLLNRLLGALFEKKHKVLLFSQFTTMLDVIVRSPFPELLELTSTRRIGLLSTKAGRCVESMATLRNNRAGSRWSTSITTRDQMRASCSC